MTEFRRRTGAMIERTQFLKVLTVIIIAVAIIFNFLMFLVRFPVENRDLVIQAQNTINNMGWVVAIAFWFRNPQEQPTSAKTPPKVTGEEN